MENIEYPTIDAPGTTRDDLPFAYQLRHPPSMTEDELLDEVRHSLPLDKLPRTLIPNAQLRWRPPTMHYGFDTTEAVVEEYAKAHNLSFYYPKEEPSDSLPSAAASGDGAEPSSDSTGGGVGAYSPSRTFYAVMRAVADESQMRDARFIENAQIASCLNSASDPSGRGNRYVASLYTNYDLFSDEIFPLPRTEEIEKMRNILRSTLPTGWYLEARSWRWQ
ncbi:uncharacterized protein B0H18DRAFT_1214604 [Fomitopsis serialis]|uniref:uncharacterized protein n=1 Tax=Fomitopsis serialis TaxID=139415 RepID=UPI0020084FA2|nr:uncharacterized protein B0H18DRAFT_1214604 [Neoantrodia serialis]KAH9917522.1 hypothetical protein B0H18DRAFT_1214604 [Neoantrodia serialis]